MPALRVCAECGSPIDASSRDGHCPRCLIGLALGPTEVRRTGDPEDRNTGGPEVRLGEFGDYELIEKIGEGGMGVVYKARQKKLKRTVALKLIRSGIHATESEIRRFRSEASAAAALQHPSIVAIHEVGEHEGQHYFSMEYIEGRNLSYIIRRTPVPAERAADTVKVIAEAIHYAHGRGVLHRDLKPHNILVDAKGHPRITDFGLAQQIGSEAEPTITGAVLGTPSYMPPEQAAGKRLETGPASDVYSLGAILYDLLTGRPPFRADTALETLKQVIEAEPIAPRLLNGKVPRDLETICLKCLAKAPGKRYQSAQELADELGRFLKHEPIRARPVGRAGRLLRWGQRNPRATVLVGAIASLLVMMAVEAVWLRHDSGTADAIILKQYTGNINGQIYRLRYELMEVTSNPNLAPLIRDRDVQALETFLRERPVANPVSWLSAINWVITIPSGAETIVRFPGPKLIENRSRRDYFTGAWALRDNKGIDSIYLSKVYRSEEDGDYKFGVSRVVKDAQGNVVGMVALMVATAEALGSKDDRSRVTLISEFDQSTRLAPADRWAGGGTDQPEFVSFFDPASGLRNTVREFSHPKLMPASDPWVSGTAPSAGVPTRDWSISNREGPLPGIWFRSYSRVPNTHIIIAYETRDRVADGLVTALGATAFVGILLLGWRLGRRLLAGKS